MLSYCGRWYPFPRKWRRAELCGASNLTQNSSIIPSNACMHTHAKHTYLLVSLFSLAIEKYNGLIQFKRCHLKCACFRNSQSELRLWNWKHFFLDQQEQQSVHTAQQWTMKRHGHGPLHKTFLLYLLHGPNSSIIKDSFIELIES